MLRRRRAVLTACLMAICLLACLGGGALGCSSGTSAATSVTSGAATSNASPSPPTSTGPVTTAPGTSSTEPAAAAVSGIASFRGEAEAGDGTGDVQEGSNDPQMGDNFPNTVDLTGARLTADGERLRIEIYTAQPLPAAPLPRAGARGSQGKLTKAQFAVDLEPSNRKRVTVDITLQQNWIVGLNDGATSTVLYVKPEVDGRFITVDIPLSGLPGLTPVFGWAVTVSSTLGGRSTVVYMDQLPGWNVAPDETTPFVGTEGSEETSTTAMSPDDPMLLYLNQIKNVQKAMQAALTTAVDWLETQTPPKKDVLAAIKTIRGQIDIGMKIEAPQQGLGVQEYFRAYLLDLQHVADYLESAVNDGPGDIDFDISSAQEHLTSAKYDLEQAAQNVPAQ